MNSKSTCPVAFFSHQKELYEGWNRFVDPNLRLLGQIWGLGPGAWDRVRVEPLIAITMARAQLRINTSLAAACSQIAGKWMQMDLQSQVLTIDPWAILGQVALVGKDSGGRS